MELFEIKYLLTTIIQFSIVLLFYTYILDLKWSKVTLLCIIIFLNLPLGVLFLFVGAPSMLYFLVILSLIIYRKTKVTSHIFHMFIGIIFLVICDNMSYLLAFRLFHELGIELFFLVGYFLFLIVFAIVSAFFYKRIVKHVVNRLVFCSLVPYILVFLSVVTVIFMYLNIMTIDKANFYDSVRNNLAMFLIYFVLLAMSIIAVVYLAFKQYKVKQREQEIQNFESYVASIEQINQDMRKFKHDYINILSSLRTFIDDRNYEGLHTYFYDHILEANHHEQLNQQAMMMLNNLKINSLKGLLTTKILQAESHQIPLYIEVVEEITDIAVDPIQLNRMVGILLDNAIEAAQGIENSEVRIAFILLDDSTLLVVSNTFDEKLNLKVHEIYQEGFSTKGENRGLGLANLRQMINQLHTVSLNTKISPPYFIQEVVFQKE